MDKDDALKALQQKKEADRASDELLLRLLDDLNEKRDRMTAFRLSMGNNTSYVSSVSLDWIAEKIGYAADIPIFKGKVDSKSKAIDMDEETVENVLQRKPYWSRQLPIAAYLALRNHRKFPPLLVVAYQNWVYKPNSNKWSERRALQDSVNVKWLDTEGDYVALDTSETSFYALDGQHRLMAIQGLKKLIKTGKLESKENDGETKSESFLTSGQVENWYRDISEQSGEAEREIERYRGIMNERIGIEILPAVIRGETIENAHSRLRSVFVYVNENAQRLKEGELVRLDEDHGFRIVARRIMTSHDLLKGRVGVEKERLAERSSDYTTLPTLVKITEKYLGCKEEYKKWKSSLLSLSELGRIRPSGEELKKGKKQMEEYFDQLSKLKSHRSVIQGENPASFRRKDEHDHILFRPKAQEALADAIGTIGIEGGTNIENLFAKLKRAEEEGGTSFKLTDPASPWFGVLCNPANRRMRRRKADTELCSQMFRFLLGGEISDLEGLRKKFYDARCIEKRENGTASVFTLNGKLKEVEIDENGVYEATLNLPRKWG